MKTTKQKTIEHYERMIKWAGRQDGNDPVSRSLMVSAIGESWFGESCPYCDKYGSPFDCGKCSLQTKNNCCNGLWNAFLGAKNWQEWITAAKAVLELIKENG